MKEFIEKLIGRLEEAEKCNHEKALEEIMENGHTMDAEGFLNQEDAFNKTIEIVNQLAEEYNNGWIPCSERLPQESEPVDTLCELVNITLKNGAVTVGWCNRFIEKWYVVDEHCDYPIPYKYEEVIAWQPLPPYKEGE